MKTEKEQRQRIDWDKALKVAQVIKHVIYAVSMLKGMFP